MAKTVDSMSFEEALGELESIVGSLESGKAPLDDSIQQYERGIALKTHCEKKLQEAQLKIEKINVGPGGKVSKTPLDAA